MVKYKNLFFFLKCQSEILSLDLVFALIRGAEMQSLQRVQDKEWGNTYFLTGDLYIIMCGILFNIVRKSNTGFQELIYFGKYNSFSWNDVCIFRNFTSFKL